MNVSNTFTHNTFAKPIVGYQTIVKKMSCPSNSTSKMFVEHLLEINPTGNFRKRSESGTGNPKSNYVIFLSANPEEEGKQNKNRERLTERKSKVLLFVYCSSLNYGQWRKMFKDIMVEVRVVFRISVYTNGKSRLQKQDRVFSFFFLELRQRHYTPGTANSLLAKKEWPRARATEYFAVYKLSTSHFSVYLSDYHWCVGG